MIEPHRSLAGSLKIVTVHEDPLNVDDALLDHEIGFDRGKGRGLRIIDRNSRDLEQGHRLLHQVDAFDFAVFDFDVPRSFQRVGELGHGETAAGDRYIHGGGSAHGNFAVRTDGVERRAKLYSLDRDLSVEGCGRRSQGHSALRLRLPVEQLEREVG